MERRRTRPRGLTATLATAFIVAACEGGAVVDPRTAAVFEMVSGDGQTGEAGSTVALPLVVRLLDQTGQPIEGQEVEFTALGSTGGTVTPVFALTGANGTAETTLRLGSSTGSYDVTAKYRSFPLIAFSATAVASPPATLVISSGNNQTATAGAPLPLPIRVRVTDAFGNPNAGVSVSFLVTVGANEAGTQYPRIAEDGLQGRTKFVRQARQEIVLEPAGLLRALVQPRVLQRHRCP